MARTMQPKVATTGLLRLDADALKNVVRDGLVGMNMAEREEFIRALGDEMKQVGLDIRAYLIPLGIPARSPEDLTPTEVGHLIRFLKINVPNKAMVAVGRSLTRFKGFEEPLARLGLAA